MRLIGVLMGAVVRTRSATDRQNRRASPHPLRSQIKGPARTPSGPEPIPNVIGRRDSCDGYLVVQTRQYLFAPSWNKPFLKS
jgi:hypothetical protein